MRPYKNEGNMCHVICLESRYVTKCNPVPQHVPQTNTDKTDFNCFNSTLGKIFSRQHIINLLSAELAQIVVKVKY